MNKGRSDWNNMKIVLSTLFISLLIQPALFGAEKCALMLEDDIDPEEYSEVMGKKIEFCCGSCVKAFDKATAYYIKAVPALAEKFTDAEKKELGVDKVTLLDQRFCPIYPDSIVNPESKTIEYNGKTIYFWSSSAQRRWKKDPEKSISKKPWKEDTFLNSNPKIILFLLKSPAGTSSRGFFYASLKQKRKAHHSHK